MSNQDSYQPRITRRESLKWMGLLAASAALPACSFFSSEPQPGTAAGHWPQLDLAPINTIGYGKDPNLIVPPRSPWPRTLSQAQLSQVSVLADLLVPGEGAVPSASQVGVPDVVDEWVSAPYELQQQDRSIILHTLAWIDDEARLRADKPFVQLALAEQLAIVEDIAFDRPETPAQFQRVAKTFARFRSLVLAAFFCSPQGSRDLGYQGNVAIAGDYPGPTPEARAHLAGILDELGLSDYAYTDI